MSSHRLLRISLLLPVLLVGSLWWCVPPAQAQTEPAEAPVKLPTDPASAQIKVGDTVRSGDQPFKPNLTIDIPDVRFSEVVVSDRGSVKVIDIPWLAQYLDGVYRYAIGIGVFLAGVMIIVGGFIYLTSGDSGRTMQAKSMISDAVLGLAVMLGSFVLLNTLSPRLTELNPVTVRVLSPEEFTAAEVQDEADANFSAGVPGATVCGSPAECTTWCNAHPDPKEWPTSTSVTVDFNTLTPISSGTGLEVKARPDASRATSETAAALKRAGEIAYQMNPNYKIVLVSASRSLAVQIRLACNKVKANKANDLGKLVAYPGGSNHGRGIAVDVWLQEGGKTLTVIGSKLQKNPQYQAGSQILDEIMTKAGFKRYSAEMWHFEKGGPSGCRCTHPNCPFPPKC